MFRVNDKTKIKYLFGETLSSVNIPTNYSAQFRSKVIGGGARGIVSVSRKSVKGPHQNFNGKKKS